MLTTPQDLSALSCAAVTQIKAGGKRVLRYFVIRQTRFCNTSFEMNQSVIAPQPGSWCKRLGWSAQRQRGFWQTDGAMRALTCAVRLAAVFAAQHRLVHLSQTKGLDGPKELDQIFK
jgi:hypothetical protein